MNAKIVGEALSAWREGERVLSALTPGTSEYEAVHEAIAQLHDAYVDLTRDAVPEALVDADRATITTAHAIIEAAAG